MSLHGLEAILKSRLRGRRLVYEVGLDESVVEDLSQQLSRCLDEAGSRKGQEIPRDFPALAVVAIAGEAVFKYSDGELYPRLEIPDDNPPVLGKIFYRSLHALGLELFPVFDEQHAQAYVSRILAHGGIPTSCLPKFYEFIDYGIDRGFEDSADYIEFLHESRRFTGQLDRPIQRFLRDTGDVGADFLARFLEVSEADLDAAPEELSTRFGVPKHVIAGLQAHREGSRTRGKQRSRSTSVTSRPVVVFDPERGRGPVLQLPPVARDVWSSQWVVTSDGAIGEERPTRAVAASLVETEEIALVPAAVWRISLEELHGASLARATVPALRDRPILVFDGKTCALITEPRYSSRHELFVLSPCELVSSTPDGLQIVSEELLVDPLWPAWRSYEITVKSVGTLAGAIGGEKFECSIGVRSQPEMTLEEPIPFVRTPDGRAVFAAPPQILEVPWGDNAERWAIGVRIGGLDVQPIVAGPPANVHRQLVERCAGRPIAELELSLRGPVGSSQRLRFAVVQDFMHDIPDRLVIPETPPIRVTLSCHSSIKLLDPKTGSELKRLQLTAEQGLVAIEATSAEGDVVPIVIQPRRLRWRVVYGADPRGSFATLTPKLGLEFAQRDTAALLQIECHGVQQRLGVKLVDGDAILQEASTTIPGRSSGIALLPLAQFHDTMRTAPRTSFVVTALVDGIDVPLVRFQERIGFSVLDATVEVTDDHTVIGFSVVEPKALNRRVARIRCIDRPWRPQFQLTIPDEVRGEVSLKIPERLRVGRYRVEIAVDDGWTAPDWTSTDTPGDVRIDAVVETGVTTMDSDPRERLASMLWGGAVDTIEPTEDAIGGPASLLLMGEAETHHGDACRLIEAFGGRPLRWTAMADTATREYGMSKAASLRSAILLLGAKPVFVELDEDHTDSNASRLLELARLALSQSRLTKAQLEDLGVMFGTRDPIPLTAVLGGRVPNDARRKQQMRIDFEQLRRIPSAPLHPTGRARGMYQLLLLPEGGAVRLLNESLEKYAELLRARSWAGPKLFKALAQQLDTARKSARQDDFLVRFHILSMLAASHVAARTDLSGVASELLCDLSLAVPDYVETRLCYACWILAHKEPDNDN